MMDILNLGDPPKTKVVDTARASEKVSVENLNKPALMPSKAVKKNREEEDDLDFLESLLEPEKTAPAEASVKATEMKTVKGSLEDEEWLDDFLKD